MERAAHLRRVRVRVAEDGVEAAARPAQRVERLRVLEALLDVLYARRHVRVQVRRVHGHDQLRPALEADLAPAARRRADVHDAAERRQREADHGLPQLVHGAADVAGVARRRHERLRERRAAHVVVRRVRRRHGVDDELVGRAARRELDPLGQVLEEGLLEPRRAAHAQARGGGRRRVVGRLREARHVFEPGGAPAVRRAGVHVARRVLVLRQRGDDGRRVAGREEERVLGVLFQGAVGEPRRDPLPAPVLVRVRDAPRDPLRRPPGLLLRRRVAAAHVARRHSDDVVVGLFLQRVVVGVFSRSVARAQGVE